MGTTIGLVKLDELQSTYEYLRATEIKFKTTLDALINMPIEELKALLLAWASAGLPNGFEFLDVNVPSMPVDCSDGKKRTSLEEYIIFTCARTVYEYLQMLQDRLVGIHVTFVVKDCDLCFLVSKQTTS